MKNSTPRIALLTVLAVAVGLIALLDRPPEDQVPNVAPRHVPAVVQNMPAFVEPVPVKPAPVIPAPLRQPAVARVPVRDDPKQIPAVENSQAVAKGLISPPELTPVAAVGSNAGTSAGTGAPEAKPADEKPDSLFGWGPWAGGQPGATTDAPTPPQNGMPSVQGLTPTVSTAPPSGGPSGGTPPSVVTLPPVVTPPPGVVPPPVTGGSILGGHGWGDKNHVHVHRRDR